MPLNISLQIKFSSYIRHLDVRHCSCLRGLSEYPQSDARVGGVGAGWDIHLM